MTSCRRADRPLRSLLMLALLLMTVSASACLYPARDTLLEGLPCTEAGECATGYFCSEDVCLRDGTLVDAGTVDGGPPLDAGPDDDAGPRPDGGVPPLQLQGALAGASHMESTSYRVDVRLGATPVSGRSQSSSYRVSWGSK